MQLCSLLPEETAALWQAIVEQDCKEALRFCLERDRGFHHARYALAADAEAARDAQTAADELRPLFTSRTRAFTVAMQPLARSKVSFLRAF